MTEADYWSLVSSAPRDGIASSRYLTTYSGVVKPQSNWYRGDGMALRCVAR